MASCSARDKHLLRLTEEAKRYSKTTTAKDPWDNVGNEITNASHNMPSGKS